MRCRRTRSYLSAYCREELSVSHKLAVSEHLSTCPDCRREESEIRTVFEVAAQLPSMKASDEFATKLFNRIAEERFSETRSKAYHPKSAPLIRWSALVPAVAGACVVALVGIMAFIPGDQQPAVMANLGNDAQARYLTAQPTHNPNMTVSMERDWSLAAHMARAERLSRLSQTVGAQVETYGLTPTVGGANVAARTGAAPYVYQFQRIRPILRSYQAPDAAVKEVSQTY